MPLLTLHSSRVFIQLGAWLLVSRTTLQFVSYWLTYSREKALDQIFECRLEAISTGREHSSSTVLIRQTYSRRDSLRMTRSRLTIGIVWSLKIKNNIMLSMNVVQTPWYELQIGVGSIVYAYFTDITYLKMMAHSFSTISQSRKWSSVQQAMVQASRFERRSRDKLIRKFSYIVKC